MKRLIALIIALAMVLSLAACAETGAAPAAATEKSYKDTLNIAGTAEPPSLDAQVTSSNVAAGIAIHIFEGLYMVDDDYVAHPVLAESYEVSDDGLTYTFHLRHGVKFHNGKEMTADDVVASMNRWIHASSKASAILGTGSFEKADDYTVVFHAMEAAADIMTLIASPVQFAAISPAEVIEASSDAEGLSEYIGTGPYKLVEWKSGQYVHLEKFEDYVSNPEEATGFAGTKEAATKDIYFRFVTDHATRVAGIQTGEYDVAEEIPTERYTELAADENLVTISKPAGVLNLFINTKEGILTNPDLRQAVLAALNCSEVLLASFGDENLYVLNNGFMNPAAAQWSVEGGKEYYNQNNPEKAKELLEKAGYAGEKIRLVTTPDYAEMYNATLVVQDQLKKAGFNAEVESYDFAVFMQHRSDPAQWDLFITSNSYTLLPQQLSVLNPGWAAFDQPEVAEGIRKIRFAENAEDAKQAWNDLQDFVYSFGAAIALGQFSDVMALRTSVEGFDYAHYPVYWNVRVAEG